MQIKQAKLFKQLSTRFVSFIFLSSFISAHAQQAYTGNETSIETSYLESKDALKDYILDTGDILDIEFVTAPDISGEYSINEEGEIYFRRIKYAYVRGLTIKELTKLLEKRYSEYLIDPEINIIISTFKPVRVAIRGAVRSPGIVTFPGFTSIQEKIKLLNLNQRQSNLIYNQNTNETSRNLNSLSLSEDRVNQSISNLSIKKNSDYLTTLSNAIQEAGGLTSYSDISKIEIVRDIPLGKGGGKKRAIIDFVSYQKKENARNYIRLFDGDNIYIPYLETKDTSIVPYSILSGLSPKFISVTISGQIETPGEVKIPIEGSLSDVMNLAGPTKPLSGKVFLIRYGKDGTILRKSINYAANASPGSNQNPYLLSGDLISVKDSILTRASSNLKLLTEPIVGIFAAREILKFK